MRNIVDCSGGLNGTGGITAGRRAGSGRRVRLDLSLCWVVDLLSFGVSRWWGWFTGGCLLSRCCCFLPGGRFVLERAVDLDPVNEQQATFQAGAWLTLFIAFLVEKRIDPQVANTERQQDFFLGLDGVHIKTNQAFSFTPPRLCSRSGCTRPHRWRRAGLRYRRP